VATIDSLALAHASIGYLVDALFGVAMSISGDCCDIGDGS